MRSFKDIMKNSKLIIGMVHMPPLPGTAHYDKDKGMNYILDVAYEDMMSLIYNSISLINPSNLSNSFSYKKSFSL